MPHTQPQRFPIHPAQARPHTHRFDGRRWGVVGLACAAVGLFAASLFQPWWQIWLFAPQYPNGLRLLIRLTGVGGDAREIDALNHYIGMAALTEAAPIERQLAGYGVAALCLALLAITLLVGRRGGWLLVATGLALPLGFVGDSLAWMWWYGHHLDPKAPLRFEPFTPELLGIGHIGQFSTYATPLVGFWLALAAVGVLGVAAWLRWRVCQACELAPTCGKACPPGFLVGPT